MKITTLLLLFATATLLRITNAQEAGGELSGAGSGGAASPAFPLEVQNTNDDGEGSLRKAIAAASPGDTITFNPSLAGKTIVLTSGQLFINKSLTVHGPGADKLKISGDNTWRVFQIALTGSKDQVVTLSGLYVTEGRSTPSVYGTVDSGGGVFFQGLGKLNIFQCEISGNSADNGGGGLNLYGGTEVNITDSTFAENIVTQGEGSFPYGGGIMANGCQFLSLRNCTISNNRTIPSALGRGVALEATGSYVEMLNCTVVGHSGYWRYATIDNDYANADIYVRNSIIAHNSDISGYDNGFFRSRGHNLIGAAIFPNPADITGSEAAPLDPLVGPLQYNGGPTRTHALLPGSPAIDKGDNSNVTEKDQTGAPRIQNGIVDIGAFESAPPNTPPTLTAPTDTTIDCAPSAGSPLSVHVTLNDPDFGQVLTVVLKQDDIEIDRQTINTPANNAPVTFATVTFTPGVHPLTVEVSDSEDGANAGFNLTVNPDTGPRVVNNPGDLELTCRSIDMAFPEFADDCDSSLDIRLQETALPVGPQELSKTRRIWTATDDNGNSVSATQIITYADKSAPQFTSVPANITVETAEPTATVVNYAPAEAIDLCSGAPTIGYSRASGAVFPVGTTTVLCTATDTVGNQATASFTVTVAVKALPPATVYSWSGVLQPVNPDGSSIFKAGSTVPVKFCLTGASAAKIDLAAKLTVVKVNNTVVGIVNEAASTLTATSGNLFRYDGGSGQYHYNWSTKGLSPGCYELQISLGDAVTRTVKVALR